jgi:lactoylglutathione lyase
MQNGNRASADVGHHRLLHTMVRVRDLDAAMDFYTGKMGMQVLRKREAPEGRYTNVFLGYGPEREITVLELTYNWDQQEPYELGAAFGHLAIGVGDIYEECKRLAAAGVKITRQPGPVQFGKTLIAFIEDPDGRKIELIQEDTLP